MVSNMLRTAEFYILIAFKYNSKEEQNELRNIILSVAKQHFSYVDFEIYSNHLNNEEYVIQITQKSYFDDIEKAKKEMYEMTEHRYMKDFVSDVLENLSFVPKVRCV